MKRTVRLAAYVLIGTMVFAFVPKTAWAKAPEPSKDNNNTCLGTGGISNPQKPEDKDSPWTGDYVYFGGYDGKPIKFRVLQKDCTAYTEQKALFLDSDESIFNDQFNNAAPFSNMWDGSHIQEVLNTDFYNGFDKCEQDAVAVSTGFGGPEFYEPGIALYSFGSPVSVNDKIILLDARDVINEDYGYSALTGLNENLDWFIVENHIKGGTFGMWYLRSAYMEANNNHMAAVHFHGEVLNTANCYERGDGNIGVAPALNVDQGAVIFATAVGKTKNEFKLTLSDADLTVAIPDGEAVSVNETKVTVPYEIGGADSENATRVSVLILDKEYLLGTSNDANIISYGSLGTVKDKSGTFTIPEGYDIEGWGKDYFVYILAEDINAAYETDYASVPVMVNVPGSTPSSSPANTPSPTPVVTPEAIKDMNNTTLGISGISDPVKPSDPDAEWIGDRVFFGTYNDKPIKFRVLAKDSTAYTSDKALFLDSEDVLFNDYYDNTEPLSHSWKDSDIRAVLNGRFLDGFTSVEKDSITTSSGDGKRAYDDMLTFHFGNPVSVEDKVFLLDAADVTNEEYGYSSDSGRTVIMEFEFVLNHKKNGSFNYWWLRSGSAEDKSHYWWRNRKSETDVGEVYPDGSLASYSVNTLLGVSPALNIDQKSILFASSIGDSKDQFKLTLIDKDLSVAIPEGKEISADGSLVNLPYEITSDATRASVLILDKEYSEGNAGDAKILYYGTLGDADSAEGSFEIPGGNSLEGWETDYFVYIFSEKITGEFETDYASVPLKIESPFAKDPVATEAPAADVKTADDDDSTNTVVLVSLVACAVAAGSAGVAVTAKKKKDKGKPE